MASVVYYKFKSSVKTDSVAFDGSAISVKDLKNAIKNKCCLHSTELDLKLEDNTGKEYTKETELIPKFTSLIVRRFPKLKTDNQKKKPAQALPTRDFSKVAQSESSHSNITNLADSDLTEDEKIRLMIDRSSEQYSSKNYTVKAKAYGIPPAGYVCHKCNQYGHWIHECPGIRDQRGNLLDSKSVKRPTGIPQDFLIRVDPGTPGAYLDKIGNYMVPIKDAEAYSQKKKEKRAFSIEENPPYVPPQERTPSSGLICPLCKKLLKDAVLIACCGMSYCNDCITNYLFDLGTRKCPNCETAVEKYESSIFENASIRRAVMDWLRSDGSPPGSPYISQPKCDSPEPEKVVRRLLKPKKRATPSPPNKAPSSEDGQKNLETNDESMASPAIPSTIIKSEGAEDSKIGVNALVPTANSDVPVKNSPNDFPANLPLVSNTSCVANLPCATTFGTGGGALTTPPVPSISSLYNNSAPLVFGNDGGVSLATAMCRAANLTAGLNSVAVCQASITSVFPGNSLMSTAGGMWPTASPADVPFFRGVMDTSAACGLLRPTGGIFGPTNPLLELHNAAGADKLLSKDEFYRAKRKLLGESSRRSRRSPSRDSSLRRRLRKGREGDYSSHSYSRRADELRAEGRHRHMRRRSHSSASSGHRRTVKGEIEDYDTWRRRKELRQREIEAFRRRSRGDLTSPTTRSSVGRRRKSKTPSESPSTRNNVSPIIDKRYRLDAPDKMRLRSPFENAGSPEERSLEDAVLSPRQRRSESCERDVDATAVSGVQLRHKRRGKSSPSVKREHLSAKRLKSISPSSIPDEAELEAIAAKKALKKLRKEQRKAARHEKRRARRAARVAGPAGAEASFDGGSPGIPTEMDGDFPGKSDYERREKRREMKKIKKLRKHHRHSRESPESSRAIGLVKLRDDEELRKNVKDQKLMKHFSDNVNGKVVKLVEQADDQ